MPPATDSSSASGGEDSFFSSPARHYDLNVSNPPCVTAKALVRLPGDCARELRTALAGNKRGNQTATSIWDNYAYAGGLVSYGPNLREAWRRVASHFDRVAKGADPATLPVEFPTLFELVVNLKTAKALGVKIPRSVLVRADSVIE